MFGWSSQISTKVQFKTYCALAAAYSECKILAICLVV